MEQYYYKGPVLEFGRPICDDWSSCTWAPTERRARSNLTYQFKVQNKRTANAKITLPGTLMKVG